MSDSLWHHGLQHARFCSSSLFPRVCSNSCPLSQWCYLTISSSASPHFSFCLQSFPALGSFPVSWFFISGNQIFISGNQSIRDSASASALPVNIQRWFPLGLIGLISLQSKGLFKSSPAPQFKSINSLALSLLYGPTCTSNYDYLTCILLLYM